MKLPFTIGNRPIQGNFDALLSGLNSLLSRVLVNAPSTGTITLLGGVIAGAGTITASTGGFTITRTAVGRYTFTLSDTSLSNQPLMLVVVPSSLIVGFVTTPANTTVTYGLNVSATGAAADAPHTIHVLARAT